MNIYKGLAAPLAFYKTSLANHLSHKCKKPIESTVSSRPAGGSTARAFCFFAAAAAVGVFNSRVSVSSFHMSPGCGRGTMQICHNKTTITLCMCRCRLISQQGRETHRQSALRQFRSFRTANKSPRSAKNTLCVCPLGKKSTKTCVQDLNCLALTFSPRKVS
jgi:hypothetical protein